MLSRLQAGPEEPECLEALGDLEILLKEKLLFQFDSFLNGYLEEMRDSSL